MLLGDVAEVVLGQSPPSSSYNDVGDGIPFYQGKADFGFLSPRTRFFCDEPKKIAKSGDILLSVRAPVGPTNVCTTTCCIGRGLAAIRPTGIDGRFLYHLLRYVEPNVAAMGTGSTFGSVNKSQLIALELPAEGCTFSQQRRAGAVLSAIQRNEMLLRRHYVLSAELKTSITRTLFTAGVAGEQIVDTEVGPLPQSWRVVPLGELAEIGNGSTPKRDTVAYWAGGSVPWLTSGKIHEGVIANADEYVTSTACQECHLPLVPAGSLVVAITGQGKTLGNTALVDFDTRVSQHLAYIRWRDSAGVVPAFFLYYLQDQYENLRGMSVGVGSTKRALTCGMLKQVLVPVPSVEERQCIAEAIGLVDAQARPILQLLRSYQELYSTVLHSLLDGEINVDEVFVDGIAALGIEVD